MGDADTTPYKCVCLWLPRDSRRHGGAEEDGQEVHQTLTEWQKESGPEGLNEMGAILNNYTNMNIFSFSSPQSPLSPLALPFFLALFPFPLSHPISFAVRK